MSETAVLPVSIVAALIPTSLYILLIYWVDRYEKEPWWLLAATFLWGAIPSILIAFIFNSVLSIPFYLLTDETTGLALAASFIAPPVEETVKGLAVLGIFLFWRDEIDSILDGIIYGAMVGMGFALVENVYYFVNVYQEMGEAAWQANIFIRGVIFGLNHALFTAMTGLGIAIGRMSTNTLVKFGAPLTGWILSMVLHFIHNATVSLGILLCGLTLLADWGGILVTLVIILWAVLQERQWLRTYLAEEVSEGTLTPAQYEIAISGRRRSAHHLNLLVNLQPRAYLHSRRFFHHCSELAYKKHHQSLFADDNSQQQAATLRQKLISLKRQLTI